MTQATALDALCLLLYLGSGIALAAVLPGLFAQPQGQFVNIVTTLLCLELTLALAALAQTPAVVRRARIREHRRYLHRAREVASVLGDCEPPGMLAWLGILVLWSVGTFVIVLLCALDLGGAAPLIAAALSLMVGFVLYTRVSTEVGKAVYGRGSGELVAPWCAHILIALTSASVVAERIGVGRAVLVLALAVPAPLVTLAVLRRHPHWTALRQREAARLVTVHQSALDKEADDSVWQCPRS